VKLDERTLKTMDASIKNHNYSTRTDFIREAVRDKLANLGKDDLMKEFMKFYGKSKKKTTYEENRKTRETVSKELLEDLKNRFG